ncbi:KTSC domain-containing protein [Mucilaginibacter sp.]
MRYHSGKVYRYLNVPEKVYKEMRSRRLKEFGLTVTSREISF